MSISEKLKQLLTWTPPKEYSFHLPEEGTLQVNSNSSHNGTSDTKGTDFLQNTTNKQMTNKTNSLAEQKEEKKIYPSIDVNLEYIKTAYNTMINSDVIIREFTISARNRQYKAFLLFIDGMVDSKLINDFILKPLMLRNNANSFEGEQNKVISEAVTNNITVRKIKKFDIVTYISDCLLPQNNVQQQEVFSSIFEGINSGNCALFIDTLPIAFDIEVKGFQQRSVNAPENEIVIKGPHQAFVENIRVNTSLLRRTINNRNLIIESVNVGKITQTKCAICYMQDITNDDLVAEVRYRLNNLGIDALLSSGQLEQLIIDQNTLGVPQIVSTERPDKAAKNILQGRVIVIVNGSPLALIMPATFIDFMSSPEDTNLKLYFANFLRAIRFLAAFLTLLLPGLYVAITCFHQEILPTELLYSILSSRQNVPFPVIFEILVLEISFELIREAGLRVPSPIGSTIGIVGALVLGQAAVSAGIVSPILIVIVAITGIASFAIPDFSFGFHLRFYRFFFIILGFIAGFLGISMGIFVYLTILCDQKSFGVPFLVPFAPSVNAKGNNFMIPPIWQQEYRPPFLDTKKEKSQDKISMKWKQ